MNRVNDIMNLLVNNQCEIVKGEKWNIFNNNINNNNNN